MADHITLTPVQAMVVARAGGAVIAESSSALMMREGDYAPVYYLPRGDVGMEFFEKSDKVTHCPHKGDATHYSMVTKSTTIVDAAWSYEAPFEAMARIKDYVAFYPDKVAVEAL